MSEALAKLSVGLAAIAATFLLILLLINFIISIRKKLPIKVNCWFCNKWTRVSYNSRNSFNCPHCLQYNGFDETGDYNKEIPEQHDELFNYHSPYRKNKTTKSNGLCKICNNNQQLKIYQLAHFVPLKEENFDIEIEHFKKQLENAYKLCSFCELIVKQTISTQTKWLLGLKIKQLKNDGLKICKNLKLTTNLTKEANKSTLVNFANILIIVIASIILLNAVYNTGILNEESLNLLISYSDYMQEKFLDIFYRAKSTLTEIFDFNNYKKFNNLTLSFHDIKDILYFSFTNISLTQSNFSTFIQGNISESLTFVQIASNPFIITFIGLLLQSIISVLNNNKFLKYPPLILWSFMLILSWNNQEQTLGFHLSQVFACCLIIYSALFKPTEDRKNSKPNYWTTVSNLNYITPNNDFLSNSNHLSSSTSTPSECSFKSIKSTFTINRKRTQLSKSENKSSCDFTVFKNVPTLLQTVNNNFSDTLRPIDSKQSPSFLEDLNSRKSIISRRNSNVTNFLNQSLNNLHIDGTEYNYFKPLHIMKTHTTVRPLISPPRFRCDSDSNWGTSKQWSFVKTDDDGSSSKSSSQTSGILSMATMPFSSNNSVCSDYDDKVSIFSKPIRLFTNYNNGCERMF